MRQRMKTVAARPEFWLLGLLAWVLLSAGRSLGTPWAQTALTEALRWGAGIGLALALSAFFHHTQAAARGILVSVGALALLGIAGGSHLERGGLVGPYQDHQLYASVLLLLLPFALAVCLTAQTLPWRLGALAVLVAGTLCLLLSQTRSSWAGLAVAALVFAGLWLGHPVRRRDWRIFTASAVVLLGAALSVWLLLAPADLRGPLAVRVGTLRTLGTDSSWQARLAVWRGAARLSETHPLSGIGLGRYPGKQWAFTGAGHPLTPSERPSLSEEAHSFYLQTAAETGLIGLGLYGAAMAAFLVRGLRRLRPSKRPQRGQRDALIIASLSLVAGQAVDALASPSWQFAEASLFFWAVLGLGMAAMNAREPEPAAAPFFSPLFSPPLLSSPLRRAGKLALSSGVAVALAANVLPLGLLTPVEAYTPAATWSFVFGSVRLTGPDSLVVGGTAAYDLTAVYYTNTAHTTTQTVTVTFDPYPGDAHPLASSYYSVVRTGGTIANSSFGTAASSTRNVLTAAPGDKSRQLSLSGTFFDPTGPHTSPALPVSVN